MLRNIANLHLYVDISECSLLGKTRSATYVLLRMRWQAASDRDMQDVIIT